MVLLSLLMACSSSVPMEEPTLDNARHATGSSTIALASDGRLVVAEPDQGLALLDPTGALLQALPAGSDGPPARVARVGERFVATYPDNRRLGVFELLNGELREVQTIDVGVEPFGIVAREDGSYFYVACQMSAEVLEFDGQTFEQRRAFPVKSQPRWLALSPDGRDLWVGSVMDGRLSHIELDSRYGHTVPLPTISAGTLGGQLEGRITGDMSFGPDGEDLIVPVIYVDADGDLFDIPVAYYGDIPGSSLERFNPAVVHVDTTVNYHPTQALLIDSTPRSYPSSATFSPDGVTIAVPMPASQRIHVVHRGQVRYGGMLENSGGMRNWVPIDIAVAGPGAEHLLFDDFENALVHETISRTVSSVEFGQIVPRVTVQATLFEVPTSDVEVGRALFHSSIDPRVSNQDNAVSCSTCHFDGRTDGLTWEVSGVRVQVPSLVMASETAPYTWFDDVDTIAEEAMLTSTVRLAAPDPQDFEKIEAFVRTFNVPDTPKRGVETEASERGKVIFNRADVGCASCHSGEHYTDGLKHRMVVNEVATPTLIGISATAPYLHDGRKQTLRDVLDWAEEGRMGNTGHLSQRELNDLEAFLMTL